MQTALAAGTTVGGLRIEAVLGHGASGIVYRARDGAGELVALKVLDPALAGDRRFRERFLREAALAGRLDHPSVVRMLATGEDGGLLYLAMAYVDGADLRTLLRDEGPLAPERALALLAGIADALDAAHAAGLVHRDVTPGNVLVGTVEGLPGAFLADFGLARHASTPTSLTGERSFVGTIDYIAPEQVRGDPLDGRADQYALACVLYACLTGAPPFVRDTDVATVFAHLNERPSPVSAGAPGLPPALDAVLARGLAKEPGARHRDCRALVAAAEAALREPPAGGRRRRTAALAAAAAALAAAVVVGVVIVDREPQRVAATLAAAPAVTAPTAETAAGNPAPADAPAPSPTATEPPLRLDADAVALVDVEGREVLRQAPQEGFRDLVAADGAAWALVADGARLVRLAAEAGRDEPSVDLPFTAGGLAASRTTVWVAEAGGPGLLGLDARSGRITARLAVDERAEKGSGIAVGAGSLWLARGALVLRVHPRTGRILARFPTPLAADRMVWGEGALWVASSADGQLYQIDPASNSVVAQPKLHGYVTDLATGAGAAWVAVTPEDVVYRLDPDDGSVQGALPAGPGPEGVAVVGNALLVANGRDGALSRIDVASGARTSLPTTSSPVVIRADGDVAWLASVASAAPLPALEDGNEIRVSIAGDELGMDPATAFGPVSYQLAYATCLRLQTYADAPGAAGRVLVPDAAVADPTVSADGRTYVFRIRPGLRFSPPSGAPITAETFRATLERALAPGLGPETPAAVVLPDVVGVAAYREGRAAHVRGLAVRGDRLSITIARPAGDFLARLALTFSCAVPPGTPIVRDGVTTPLATGGPYYVAARGPGRTVLLRNPAYTGSRPRRPERIVYEIGLPTARATALLDDGRIDYVPFDFDTSGPLAQGGELERRFGPESAEAAAGRQRYFPSPAPGLDLLGFNTRRGPFRDVRLRRAVNAALDRPAIAAVWGEEPSDRYVPPAILTSPNGAAYPVDGPDVERARELAPPRRATADLYFCGAPENRRVVAIVRADLARIGITVRPLPSLACTLGDDPLIDRAELILLSPSTPIVDPAPFVEAPLGSAPRIGAGLLPSGWWSDPPLARAIVAARPVQGDARVAAYAELQRRLLEDAVPFAALGSWTAPEYIAPRLGCRVIQGALGFLDLGAACPGPPSGA